MNDFLVHIGWLTLSMSFVILLVLLFNKGFGGRFSAKSRYTVWTVVIFSLCIGIGLFKLPALFTVEVSMPSLNEAVPEAADLSVTAETGPLLTNPPSVVTPTTPVKPSTSPNPGSNLVQPNEQQEVIVPAVPATLEEEPLNLDFSAILFGIWAAGAVLYFSVSMAVYIRITHKYARGKKICDAETEALFRAMCRKYKVKEIPRIYVCSEVGSPVLYGYTKPTILLPDIFLSENSLVGVLAHEVTHYRRGDLWVKFACLMAESLYWFNPLVYIAAGRCNGEMELSCDEAVLAGMDEDVRRTYGNVMLEIVKHCSRRRSSLTTQFNPHKNAVKERIMNILDMTKKKRGRVIIASVLVLCLVFGTVIGCTVDQGDNEILKESVYTIETGVTSVDSHAFENVDTDGITELVIGGDVESIDFAYLNTFAKLQKITVDEQNQNFRSFTSSTNASILTSLKTREMLFIPSEDHWLQLWNESEVAVCYPAGEDIRIYSCGGVLTVYYIDYDHGEFGWMLKSIEYHGMTKTLDNEKQITGHCSFDVFRISGGFVASHSYYSWSNAFIFKEGICIEYNPYSEGNWEYGINASEDGVTFYPNENGDLFYQRTTANMVAIQTYEWFLSLSSADQFWKEEGVVTISGGELIFTPSKTYTVTDYFAQRETTVEEEFERLKDMGVITEYETLEELFAANHSDDSTHFLDPAFRDVESAGDTSNELYLGKSSIAELMDTPVLFKEEKQTVEYWMDQTGYSVIKYTVLDLDGDGTSEIIFWLAHGADEYSAFLILHGTEEEIYGHMQYYRAFTALKTDGTFCFSSGVANRGCGKFTFDGAKLGLGVLAHCEGDADDLSDITYSIGNNGVSKERFDAYITEQNQKPGVEWHEISENTGSVADASTEELYRFLNMTFREIESAGYTLEYSHMIGGGWPVYGVAEREGVSLVFEEQSSDISPIKVEISASNITIPPGLYVSMTGEETKKSVASWDGVFFSLETGGRVYITTYIHDGYKITAYWAMPEEMYNDLAAGLPEDGGDEAFVDAKKKLVEPFKNHPVGEIVGLSIEKAPANDQSPVNEEITVPQEYTSDYIHVEAISAFPKEPSTAWKIYDPMMTPIYYFFDKGLTYYCRYEYHGDHYEKNTLILPEGHTNGEIFYVRGTGGSAEMYLMVKTDQGYLRYYSSVNHYPDEIISVTEMTEDEVVREKEYMASENLQVYLRELVGYLYQPFEPGEAQYPDSILGLVYEYCFYNRGILDGVTVNEDTFGVSIDGTVFRAVAKSLFGDDFTVSGRDLVGGGYDEATDRYTTSYAKDYWGGDRYTIEWGSDLNIAERDGKVMVTAMVGINDEVYGIYVPFRPLEYTFRKVDLAGYWHYQIEKITAIEESAPDTTEYVTHSIDIPAAGSITVQLPVNWVLSDDGTYKDTDGIRRLEYQFHENRSEEEFKKEIEEMSPNYACDMSSEINGTTLSGHRYLGYTLDGVGSLASGRATTQIYRFRFELSDALSLEMDFYRRKDYDIDAGYYEKTIPPILASVGAVQQQTADTKGSGTLADYKNQSQGDGLVYEGYTVEYDLPHPYDEGQTFPFHIHLPQLRSSSAAAVKWNEEIIEKYSQTYDSLLGSTVSGGNQNQFASVTYETVVAGEVMTIYIIDSTGILNSGAGRRFYDIYHYDSAKQRFLTTDEFLSTYAKGQFAGETVADMVRFMNEIVFTTDEVGNPYPLTEANIVGVIPSVFGDGKFDVVYKGYSVEGSWSARVLFSPYPTITAMSVTSKLEAEFTYRLVYDEYTTCREKEMYGQPAGYRLHLGERSLGSYSTGYSLDCLLLEDIGEPPEGSTGDSYNPIERRPGGRMYLSIDHETDGGHVKTQVPFEQPGSPHNYYRGVIYKYFSYERILRGNHQVNLDIARLVSDVLDAYRNGEDPNELFPVSKTEYVPYPLENVRENPDADEIEEILANASVTSSGIINFAIDLGGGYTMGLPIKIRTVEIDGYGEYWDAYFTGVYIAHGTPRADANE